MDPSKVTTAAFPCPQETFQDGMSLRAYAAIRLRVPDSGVAWLDQMIIESRGMDLSESHRLTEYHAELERREAERREQVMRDMQAEDAARTDRRDAAFKETIKSQFSK